jgi:hypothetical protein
LLRVTKLAALEVAMVPKIMVTWQELRWMGQELKRNQRMKYRWLELLERRNYELYYY